MSRRAGLPYTLVLTFCWTVLVRGFTQAYPKVGSMRRPGRVESTISRRERRMIPIASVSADGCRRLHKSVVGAGGQVRSVFVWPGVFGAVNHDGALATARHQS